MIALVGQETMHSPHWTQPDSPIASSRSNAMPAVEPLPVRPMMLLRFTSSHARAQRSHSTHALWSTMKTGDESSFGQ